VRFSRLLIPTTKETPNDATLASHIYLIRAGLIQSVGDSGLYNFVTEGKTINARFSFVYALFNVKSEKYPQVEWKIISHHSSVMPET